MERSEFTKVLKTTAEIELRRYEIGKIMESLRDTAIKKNILLSGKIAQAQQMNESDRKKFVRAGFLKFILGLLAAFVIGIVISIVILFVSTIINLILLWRFENVLEKISIVCLILPFVSVIVAAVKMIVAHSTAKKDIVSRESAIDSWQKELIQVQKNCDSQLDVLQKESGKYFEPLGALYSVIPVHYKYRNAAALMSFVEYFETGRCRSLEGPDGAYNLYENEIRMNAILSKLDDVILNLKQIQQNQYALYHGMMQVKNNIDSFSLALSEASDQMRSMEEDGLVRHWINRSLSVMMK